MKKENTKNKWLLFGIICIILGICSFSNHPSWGNWVTGFGAAIVIISFLKKSKIKTRN